MSQDMTCSGFEFKSFEINIESMLKGTVAYSPF